MNGLLYLQCNEINASTYCERFCIKCKRKNFQIWYGNFLKKTVVGTLYIYIYIYMSKDLSAKHYQNNKEILQKNLVKNIIVIVSTKKKKNVTIRQ